VAPSGVAAELWRFLALQEEPEIEIVAQLDEAERARAVEVLRPERLADVDRYGLGPTLTGRPLLRERYRHGTPLGAEQATPTDARDGQALVDGLLAWRAAVDPGPIADEYARAVWARMRGRRGRHDRPDDERWRRATTWATADVVPGIALVRWDEAAGGWCVDPAVRDEAAAAASVALAHEAFGDVIRRWVGVDEERATQVAELAAEKGGRR
jgi:hypothetical protein